MLDQWRRIAILQSDPDRFRRVARRAAEANVGRPSLEDEPLSVTRTRAGIRQRANVCSVPLGPAGEGVVIYLIQENERLVKVLEVVWRD